MLYTNISTVNLYKNYGYQFSDNIFVFGNRIYNLNYSEFENYPAIPDNLYLTAKENLQIFSNNRSVTIFYDAENPKQIMSEFFFEITTVYNDAAVLIAVGVCI